MFAEIIEVIHKSMCYSFAVFRDKFIMHKSLIKIDFSGFQNYFKSPGKYSKPVGVLYCIS